ncbi:MAG TPA: trypsin-like peptidase domain-containing protein [Chitinophagaceae bacterium]|nr:trypsin-like peptidase domain-containing protein [Chitinophagaceae bacterium]
MKAKQILTVMLLSASTAVVSVWGYQKITSSNTYFYSQQEQHKTPANYAGYYDGVNNGANAPVDFTQAAATAIPATVHIKTKSTRTASNNLPRRSPFNDLFGMDLDDLFGDRMRTIPQMASGTGAIISEDGFVVTNNHVVSGADEVTVTLSNKRSFTAKVVAADPSTDIALLKIDAKGLPFLLYGNSDEVKVGQWVIAVGYPLTLEATVTAGIVSAKGRTLDINRRQSSTPIESFIQTDAAVNPGNSGGPLVSTDGKLIGINSAIASPTGTYAGYSFTIPVNIVRKIVNDLMKHGTVQRAYLGISYPSDNISDEAKKQNGIKDEEGVYITDVPTTGAAYAAGLRKGDVITKINGVTIYNGADMVGQIATFRPGDKVTVSYKRDGKEFTVPIVLRNSVGTTDAVKLSILDKLGADLQTLDKDDAQELGVKGGVIVRSFTDKSPFNKTRMEQGFVILKVNGTDVHSVHEFRKALENAGNGTVKLDGIYPGYTDGAFTYPLRLSDLN